MTNTPQSSPPAAGMRVQTLVLYWGALVTGLILPSIMKIITDTGHRHQPLSRVLIEYVDGFWLRLFAPGDGLIFISLYGSLPFAMFAIFTLFHLGLANRRGELIARRRWVALLASGVAMMIVSVWGQYSILTAKGSTAAIGFIFLPFYVLIAALAGYGLGRLIGRARIH